MYLASIVGVVLFSPPYGDGTPHGTKHFDTAWFSSPCGDNLQLWLNLENDWNDKFPSPYGAAPLYHGGGTIEIPFQGEP